MLRYTGLFRPFQQPRAFDQSLTGSISSYHNVRYSLTCAGRADEKMMMMMMMMALVYLGLSKSTPLPHTFPVARLFSLYLALEID